MVRAGIGSAVLPWLALHGSDAWSDDRLSIHQLRPSPARTLYLHWPAHRTRSPLATRAIDIAVEAANELASQM
jgi:DNA-binding transcriptional LysR family regulator